MHTNKSEDRVQPQMNTDIRRWGGAGESRGSYPNEEISQQGHKGHEDKTVSSKLRQCFVLAAFATSL